MIMIIGSSHDDVLYFETIMTDKQKDMLFERFPVVTGRIFNQEVLLVDQVYSNYLTSALALHLIQKYMVILVFSVGKATAYSHDWKLGDIAVSQLTFAADVDQTADTEARFGQIPLCPAAYPTQGDVLDYLTGSLESKTDAAYYRATFVSTNVAFTSQSQLVEYDVDGKIFGREERVVLDSTLGGVAVAAALSQIPFIGVKVIARFLDKPYTVNEYAAALTKYNDIGKAIVTTIGDIGRTDIMG
ncbi:MAG: hypothetical protein K6F32_05475 [Bacilli bacterium]|nr:hypothetical protein [Bacilli bacterium]